jgi:predicted helicase
MKEEPQMAVETFLTDVAHMRKAGNATEHTYRATLETLFNAVMTGCKAVNEPKRAAYGAPDFVIQQGTIPIGYVEAKNVGVDLGYAVADSERETPRTANGRQLKRYRAALPNLLYTDGLVWYWFVAGEARLDRPVVVATWEETQQRLQRLPDAVHALTTLLQQFAAHQAPLVGTPKELARRLAQMARWLDEVIREVLAEEGAQGSLHQQVQAFRETLLPTLTVAEFADMYAQTLVYGLFAARVSDAENPVFTRHAAAHSIPRSNPFLRKIFSSIAGIELDERIAWLVDDCAHVLERTDMSEVLRTFGKATMQEDPVVHFYETFLAAYDPRMREMRGVYYTPEPVVGYIVRSVDYLLRHRFGRSLGLADGETLVLDPATGTATFLQAVVQHVYGTLQGMGMVDTWNQYVPEKLLPRLFGFELLMAPYTVAHLKLSMLLQQLGYRFESDERLGIYLTNALADAPTGQQAMPFAQFIAEEGQAADAVKHKQPVLVVLGNPPYSGHSANTSDWIDDLLHGKLPDGRTTANYYTVDGKPLGERNPKWLQDDYVKFLRFGQWRINQTGEGILAFISNNGYLDNPTFRGMRESLVQEFDTIYILNLHGNSKKKERAPDGSPDENVFDIRQGVAIGIFVRRQPAHTGQERATVYYADVWGRRKGKYALLNAHDVQSTDWQELNPTTPWYLLVPQDTSLAQEYEQGWKITDIAPVNVLGFQTHRDKFAVDFARNVVSQRIKDLHDTLLTDDELRQRYVLNETDSWNVSLARQQLRQLPSWEDCIVECAYRPFDNRFVYYSEIIVDRPRPELITHVAAQQNLCLLSSRQQATVGYQHCWVADVPANDCVISTTSREANQVFPLYLYPNGNDHPTLFDYQNGRRPNLSAQFIGNIEQQLNLAFIPDGAGDLDTTVGPEDVLHYLYAVLHSPTYRTRYAAFLKIDFPRVPITSDKELFKRLAAYGAALVDLHLLRLPGSGGVGGAGGAALLDKPTEQGISQQAVTTAPIDRVSYHAQHQRVVVGKDMFFEGVEPAIWDFQIGGYQPLQKWLRDRKGRTLSFDDALHYMRMIVALRETQRLMAEIDQMVSMSRLISSTRTECVNAPEEI